MTTAEEIAKKYYEGASRAMELELDILRYLEYHRKRWDESINEQSELFETIAGRLLSQLGAELSRMTKEDLIKIISNKQ